MLDSNSLCIACPANCISCIYNTTNKIALCRACNNTYILDINNNKCNKCPSSCAVCSVYDSSVCLQCWDGWYVNSNNGCSKCDSVCSKCNGYGNCV